MYLLERKIYQIFKADSITLIQSQSCMIQQLRVQDLIYRKISTFYLLTCGPMLHPFFLLFSPLVNFSGRVSETRCSFRNSGEWKSLPILNMPPGQSKKQVTIIDFSWHIKTRTWKHYVCYWKDLSFMLSESPNKLSLSHPIEDFHIQVGRSHFKEEKFLKVDHHWNWQNLKGSMTIFQLQITRSSWPS